MFRLPISLAVLVVWPALTWSAVDTLRTTGVGSPDTWTASTGTKYTCVDEDTPNGDGDYVYVVAVSQQQTFTVSDIAAITSVDSVWIKASWTWTKTTGGPVGCGLYYYNGVSWSGNFQIATTKSSVYVRDSIKWTSPSVDSVNAMQVRSMSVASDGSSQTRVTWWGIYVYGTVSGAAKSQVMPTVLRD